MKRSSKKISIFLALCMILVQIAIATTSAIEPTDLSNCSITLSQNSYVYDTTAKKPDVTVELEGETLIKDTDYSVSYENNIDYGYGKVTVSGKNSYTGSKDTFFLIAEKDIELTEVATGYRHTVILKSDGTVYAFGSNGRGELGNGTTTKSFTPVQVKGVNGEGFLTDIVDVSAGSDYTVALKSDGTVYAFGWNLSGQLGDGTKTDSSVPVQVKGVGGEGFLTDIVAISVPAGSIHTVALRSDGTVYAFGSNGQGQLGNGTEISSSVPVQVKGVDGEGILTDIVAVSAGSSHTVALKSDGTVYTFGYNLSGQLGDGTTNNSSVPVQVKGLGGEGVLADIVAVSAGGKHNTVALKSDGTIYAFGSNTDGQLGDGTRTNSSVPVQVKGIGGEGFLTDIVKISVDSGTVALKSDGTVYTFGDNFYGQLGDGTRTDRLTPVQVKGVDGEGVLTGIVAVSAGYDYTIVLKSDGLIYGFGYSNNGKMGNEDLYSQNFLTPFPIFNIFTLKEDDAAEETDLSVSAVKPTGASLYDGDDTKYTCTVRNNSKTIATTGDIRVDFYRDNKLFDTVYVTKSIEADGYIAVTTSKTYTEWLGSHTVRAVINSDHVIPDSNTANNSVKARFFVADE